MDDDHISVFRNVRFLAGPIHAGFPSPADDWKEKRLDVNDLVVPHPISTYFMHVEGDSMYGACIDEGISSSSTGQSQRHITKLSWPRWEKISP
jgi:SOS-response transcriptional repressor LexA